MIPSRTEPALREGTGERGALMVGLMAAVAIMLIVSTVAFQSWEDVIRRDKEAEMMFRAQSIARALKKYQKAQGTFPTELKKLMEKTGAGQYVLRKLYKDPLVKDGKWGLLFMAPGGGIFDPNAQDDPDALDASGQPKSAKAPAFGMGGATAGSNTFPGSAGSPPAGAAGAFGQPAGAAGEQQGLPIAGVRSLCKDKPFRVFREQTEYDKWLFTVLDTDLDGPVPGQPAQLKPPGGGLPGGTKGPGTIGGSGTGSSLGGLSNAPNADGGK